jgi:hypothetical protein
VVSYSIVTEIRSAYLPHGQIDDESFWYLMSYCDRSSQSHVCDRSRTHPARASGNILWGTRYLESTRVDLDTQLVISLGNPQQDPTEIKLSGHVL